MAKQSKNVPVVPVVVDENMTQVGLIGRASGNCHASLVALLRGVKGDSATVDEDYVAKLRRRFQGDAISAQCGIDLDAACDYLPALDWKLGQKAKWSAPPEDDAKFDAKIHRPKNVQAAYRTSVSQWSLARDAAGYPALKAAKAPTAAGGKTATAKTPAPRTIETFVAPTDLDTAQCLKLARSMSDAFAKAVSSKRVIGDAGQVLRDMARDMIEYVNDCAAAILEDTKPAAKAADEMTVAEARAIIARAAAADKARKAA